jgi:hypothetical protein
MFKRILNMSYPSYLNILMPVILIIYSSFFVLFGCLDPKVSVPYKMEVLRDPESRFRPLFRVTVDGGEQVGFYYEI